jgi:hypothetical protein
MAGGSDDCGTSDDGDGASQDETPFEERLHQMLAKIAGENVIAAAIGFI